jgi:hypothetical protein
MIMTTTVIIVVVVMVVVVVAEEVVDATLNVATASSMITHTVCTYASFVVQ